MGLWWSTCRTIGSEPPRCQQIEATYRSDKHLKQALAKAKCENCELIVGVDFTASNMSGGRTLHLIGDKPNPYQNTLELIGNTLIDHDDDERIPCYGFGDEETKDTSVFSFFPGEEAAMGCQDMIARYREIASKVKMSGPTSFAPIVKQAMKLVCRNNMRFHVLLIIADGGVVESCVDETKKAIIDATNVPLSIVVIGVGDGPWNCMESLERELGARPWDNFNFVRFDRAMNGLNGGCKETDEGARLKVAALRKVPGQMEFTQNLSSDPSAKKKAWRIVRGMSDTICKEPAEYLFETDD